MELYKFSLPTLLWILDDSTSQWLWIHLKVFEVYMHPTDRICIFKILLHMPIFSPALKKKNSNNLLLPTISLAPTSNSCSQPVLWSIPFSMFMEFYTDIQIQTYTRYTHRVCAPWRLAFLSHHMSWKLTPSKSHNEAVIHSYWTRTLLHLAVLLLMEIYLIFIFGYYEHPYVFTCRSISLGHCAFISME